MRESSVAESPPALASVYIRSQALGERNEGKKGWAETDWASAREQWVSLWAGVWGWRERIRNPVESFWCRMLSSPPGLVGMHCRCGCCRQYRVIWWEIIRGGSQGHPTHVHTQKYTFKPNKARTLLLSSGLSFWMILNFYWKGTNLLQFFIFKKKNPIFPFYPTYKNLRKWINICIVLIQIEAHAWISFCTCFVCEAPGFRGE